MKLKAVLLLNARPVMPPDEEAMFVLSVPWRLGADIMQPWQVCDNPALQCRCPSRDMRVAECEWHGVVAERMGAYL